MSLTNQQPETTEKQQRTHLEGLVRDTQSETSRQVSVMSDGPFSYRHCKTEAFIIARITSIHRLNLPTANLQRQSATVFVLPGSPSVAALPVSISGMACSYSFLKVPASHLADILHYFIFIDNQLLMISVNRIAGKLKLVQFS